MTAATDMHCLSDETLAAYLDRALDEAARASVIEHLGSCDECRSKAIEVRRTLEILKQRSDVEPSDPGPGSAVDVEPEPPTPAPPPNAVRLAPKPKSRWRWTIAAVAAGGVIAVVLLGPMRDSIFDKPGIPELVKASESLEERHIDGRVMGGFPYKTRARTFRGDPKQIPPDQYPLYVALGEISNARNPNPHELGVGLLLTGQRAAAIKAFREALAKRVGDPAVVESDLGVALMAGDDNERKEALAIFERAWSRSKTPETAWNRAYALQNLDRYEDAIAAWDEYLKIDPVSPWRQEALQQRDKALSDLALDLELKRDAQLRRP